MLNEGSSRKPLWIGLAALGGVAVIVLAFQLFLRMVEPPCKWDAPRIAVSEATGDQIVAALLKHKIDHGTFPSTLETLVPQYLASIDEPTAGSRKWLYEPNSFGKGFTLTFGCGRYFYPNSSTSSQSPSVWQIDQ